MAEEKEQTFKESVIEILLLTKMLLTSFWFWLPVAFLMFLYLQILMFFFIHPLTVLIAPAVLSLYAIRLERKRLASRYPLGFPKDINSLHHLENWNPVEKRVEEYQELIQEQEKE